MNITGRSSKVRAEDAAQKEAEHVSDLISILALVRDSLSENSSIDATTRLELEKSLSEADAFLRGALKGG